MASIEADSPELEPTPLEFGEIIATVQDLAQRALDPDITHDAQSDILVHASNVGNQLLYQHGYLQASTILGRDALIEVADGSGSLEPDRKAVAHPDQDLSGTYHALEVMDLECEDEQTDTDKRGPQIFHIVCVGQGEGIDTTFVKQEGAKYYAALSIDSPNIMVSKEFVPVAEDWLIETFNELHSKQRLTLDAFEVLYDTILSNENSSDEAKQQNIEWLLYHLNKMVDQTGKEIKVATDEAVKQSNGITTIINDSGIEAEGIMMGFYSIPAVIIDANGHARLSEAETRLGVIVDTEDDGDPCTVQIAVNKNTALLFTI